MKVGLFFGSFNPIHHGHLIIANYVITKKLVDQVWLIVSPHNPFKRKSDLINEYNRLHLAKLAVENCTNIKVSDIEFKLPRPSYTIQTLDVLKSTFSDLSFSLLIGADSYENIFRWKDGEKIVEGYELIVYRRAGIKIERQLGDSVKFVNNPIIEISATDIRRSLKSGESVRYLMPDKVIDEIERCNLYRN
jgi:nicotinate-nucleotide adenylyltransferase